MAIYYVVLSGALVFTLGYLAGWRHAKRRHTGSTRAGSTRTVAADQ
jgi:hypothetical protein